MVELGGNLGQVRTVLRHRSAILAHVSGRDMLLPGLPEVMLRVKSALADPNCSQTRLSGIIAEDPQLATRLIKVANAAALYRGRPLNSLSAAVARLGQARVSTLVTSLALMQMMQATRSGSYAPLLHYYTRRSRAVAATAFSFAKAARLDADQALLAGIVHAIGALPIIGYARENPQIGAEIPVPKLVELLYPEVGAAVLRTWNFAPELVTATTEHPNLERQPAAADCADLITAALVDHYRDRNHPRYSLPPEQVPAYRRLGLAPGDASQVAKQALAEAQALLA